MIEHLRRPGAAGVRDLVAQPRAGAGSLRPRHVRAGGRSRRGTRSPRSRRRAPSHLDGGVLGRDHHRGTARPPGGRRASSADVGEPDADGVRARQRHRRARRRRSPPASVAAAAVAESARKGYLDGQALAGVFAWLRPNDLIWNYVVNNYLLGKEPPAFDILYWNQDTVRLAAGLHRDFIQHRRSTTRSRSPGAFEVLGDPRRPRRRSTLDSYIVAGADGSHRPVGERVQRRRSCSAANRGSCCRPSGHIQALDQPAERRTSRSELPRRRRAAGARPGGIRGAGDHSCRQLVAGLRDAWLADAVRRAEAGAEVARQREVQGARQRRPGPM